MKKNYKNFIWLAVSATSFMLLIVAMFAIGFKYSYTSSNIIGISAGSRITLGNMETSNSGYGWLVSSLIFSATAIVAVIIKIILNSGNNKQGMSQKTWDFIFAGIISFAVILMIIGSSVMISDLNNSFWSVDAGMAFLLFLILALAWVVVLIPFFIGKIKKNSKRKATK